MHLSHPHSLSSSRWLISAVLALLLALLGLWAPTPPRAAAVPAQDYLELAALQDLLETAPNGIAGHMLTVLGGSTTAQQAPVEIPVTVHSVVPDAGPAGPLLLFSADLTDPAMARIGTIAAGMSGSPILVQDGGIDKVVGAVSYGDAFTTGGLGLATPIEDMIAVERGGLLAPASTASAEPLPIDPITVAGRTISKIVVTAPGASAKVQAAAEAAAEADSSTAYFKPLFGIQVGGLPVGSAAYKQLAKAVTKHGLPVLAPHGTGTDGRVDDFQTDIEPGASAGVFYALGSLSYGAVGTVTYTTSDGGAVAFGHPMLWIGSTAAYFTNAWIDGVWSSSQASYKLGSPGQARGTLVQDRSAGVGARLDTTPPGVPVTSKATLTADGTTTKRTATTQIAPVSFTTWFRSSLPAAAASQAIVSAADVGTMAGSASTVLTIHVSEGTNQYTVVRPNLFDDSRDVLWEPGYEVAGVLETILSYEDPRGITTANVKSVDLTASITQDRAQATIQGIASSGLRTGTNTVFVIVRPHGSAKDGAVPVRLTLPAGMSVKGVLTATSGWWWDEELDSSSLAALVSSINKAPANNDIVVEFRAADDDDDEDDDDDDDDAEDAAESAEPVRGLVRTSWVIDGSAEAVTSAITLVPSASTITAGETYRLHGIVGNAKDTDTVSVQRRTAGSATWTTLKAAVDLNVVDDVAQFDFTDKPQYNSVYRVRYAGSGGTILGSSADVTLAVRGRVTMSGTATTTTGFNLAAALTPKRAGSQIVFERYASGSWTAIKTVTTGTDGRATYPWKVAKGTYQVRARLVGTTDLTANVSATVRLTR